MNIKKVVIPTAGLATRMFPATKAVQKGMLPIYDRPTLQYVIKEVVDAGIEDVIFIVNEDYFSINKHFNTDIDSRILNSSNILSEDIEEMKKILKCNFEFVIQKEQKGLGHAILCAKDMVGSEDFCVILGDVIVNSDIKSCTSQLLDIYNKYNKTVVGIEEVPMELVNRYGILDGIEIEKNVFDSKKLVEKPEIGEVNSNLAMVGRYIVKNEIFSILESQKEGKNNEIQFTDALNELTLKGELLGLKFKGKTYDVGNKLGVLVANIEYGLRDKNNREKLEEYLKNLVNSNFNIGDNYES